MTEVLLPSVKIDRSDKKSPKTFNLDRDFFSRKQWTSHGAIVWKKNSFLGGDWLELKFLKLLVWDMKVQYLSK